MYAAAGSFELSLWVGIPSCLSGFTTRTTMVFSPALGFRAWRRALGAERAGPDARGR
jgi:hypothetical protein